MLRTAVIGLLIVLGFVSCTSGMRLPSGGESTSSGVTNQDSGGGSGSGGVSSVGTLTMSSRVGQPISRVPQTSSSGRFQRN